MQKFKERWEIKDNWQMIFPLLGIIGLLLSSFLISKKITIGVLNFETASKSYILAVSIVTLFIFVLLLGLTLRIFGVLAKRWEFTYRWELIAIFIVFAITGSAAAKISAPLLSLIGLSSETTNSWVYWPVRILLIFPIYQVLLVLVGWTFGQFNFFWTFEKKMLRRIGFSRFLKE